MVGVAIVASKIHSEASRIHLVYINIYGNNYAML